VTLHLNSEFISSSDFKYLNATFCFTACQTDCWGSVYDTLIVVTAFVESGKQTNVEK